MVMTVAVGLVWLAVQLLPVLLVMVIGLMMVGMVAPVVRWLESRHVRRGVAIAVVFTGMLLSAGLLGALTLPRLVAQVWQLADRMPQMQAELAQFLQGNNWSAPLAQSVRGTRIPELMANGARLGLSYSPQIAALVGYAVTSVFFSLYLLIDRDRMRGGLFALVPRSYHVRLSRILIGLETIVGGYMRGQVLTSVLITVFTFVVLLIAGVPNAIALAVFAGMADVLPYVGGILACGPAVLAASTNGPTSAAIVLAVLLLYQEFESRFIVPRVYGNVLRLPSSVVIIALLVGGKLLGILGALLALPIAAGVRMIVEELRVDLPGETSDPATTMKDARGEREYETRAAGVPVELAAGIATEIAQKRLAQDAAAVKA
jgi:predicted PurR-regulated permease PerM